MDTDINNDIAAFAQTNFRDHLVKFGIKRDDRRRHMYLIGKTGMGKSNALENMVISDIKAGNGVCLIDPHGDTAEKILRHIPNRRINDVVYFNPADMDYPIAFNILESVDSSKKHLVASGLIGVFKKIWADSWGPRLEYVLRNAILALLDYNGSTLLGITRLMVDKDYRKEVVEKIQDPVVKSFWVNEYSKYPDKFQVEAISPIQNKVGQFLSNALIRNVVGQVKSTINMREIMDNKKIFIANLSKGRIGEDTSALLGAMFITKLYLAAMSRIDVVEEERQDFYLYVDEFQNFATESFANILSEARKYRLNLIIAHQYIEQLDEKVAAAVFGNVGTIICFRVGAADAEELEKEFMPNFTKEDLVNLSKYNIYLRLMIDGVASDPFSATTLPPDNVPTNNHEKIIKVSREQYANPRAVVEEKISRWTQVDELIRRTEQGERDKELASQFSSERIKIQSKQFKKEKPKIFERNPKNEKVNFVSQKKEVEEKNFANKEKEISLNEAFKKGAVNFSGKPLIDKPQKFGGSKNTKFKDTKKDESNNLKASEIDDEIKPIQLSNGEVVKF
ncbi:MAG: type IV secretion system DNA-binding domain-containing protein [bacterium]